MLEEATRLLYREWFVHFRFPGHEHLKDRIDGIPEGWERRTVGKITELKYGRALKQTDRVEGPFSVVIRFKWDIELNGSDFPPSLRLHRRCPLNVCSKSAGRKGNVGSIYWSPFEPTLAGQSTPSTSGFPKPEQTDFWLYLALPSAGFQNTDGGVPGAESQDFAIQPKTFVV